MIEVYPQVFVGAEEDFLLSKSLHREVTHILTLTTKPLSSDFQKDFVYKFVHVIDDDTFNLLEVLSECLQFIEEGTAGSNRVLVHCLAGISRSGAVATAYVMRKMEATVEEALRCIREKKPDVSPNDGFLNQLQLFYDMGWKVDKQSQIYQIFQLALASIRIKQIQSVDRSVVEDLIQSSEGSCDPGNVLYKCRKCRRVLFSEKSVIRHSSGAGPSVFDRRLSALAKQEAQDGSGDSNDGVTSAKSECSLSLFLQPVEWMAEDILQTEGKINCPKCSAKLGSFKWIGERCPCGRWLCPAFHVQTSKVDKMRPVTKPSSQTFKQLGHMTPEQA